MAEETVLKEENNAPGGEKEANAKKEKKPRRKLSAKTVRRIIAGAVAALGIAATIFTSMLWSIQEFI